MGYEFERLSRERRVIKGKISPEMIAGELRSAEYDLSKAKQSYKEEDYKWTTIKAYYAMFHGIRALVYGKGWRERSHYALMIAFKELFIDASIFERKYYKYFEDAMELREGADYRSEYSEAGASEAIKNTEELLKIIKTFLEK